MTTIRVASRQRFAVVDQRAVRDERLSFRARGILVWLLDKPDDWCTRTATIVNAGTEGRDAVLAALHELEALGYFVRRKTRNLQGHWKHEVTVHEQPLSEMTDDTTNGFPGPGFPAPVFQAVSNESLIDERLIHASTDKPPRKRDPIFDCLAELTRTDPVGLTIAGRGVMNRACKELRAVGAEPDEIRKRWSALHRRYPNAALTAPALVKHWAALGTNPKLPNLAVVRTIEEDRAEFAELMGET